MALPAAASAPGTVLVGHDVNDFVSELGGNHVVPAPC